LGEGDHRVAKAVDRFEVLIDPAAAFRPADDGRSLIELVRAAEEPWARAEYLERLPEFENPDEFRFEPGDYHYLAAHTVLLPSREWLGRPSDLGFGLDTGDPRRGKTMVLGCTCGVSECWFVQARIEVGPEMVRWSEFGQFHRPECVYGLGPFTFDRREYETQLAPRHAEPSAAADRRGV
jgi:hypothetical protein